MVKMNLSIIFLTLPILFKIFFPDIVIANQIKIGSNNEHPKIIFEEQKYDFGKIYIGEISEHRFKFKNSGSGELVINNVKSTCGCTAVLVSKNTLLKNEVGEVIVRFHAGHNAEKVTKSITITSNDPDTPEFKLSIAGEIIEEISINPMQINFGIVRYGTLCTRSIEIKTEPDRNVFITNVESLNPHIKVHQIKNINKNTFLFQISIPNTNYLGSLNGNIFVYTNSNIKKRIDIPVYGEIIGDFVFYPKTLYFGSIKKNQVIKKTIFVNFANKDLKIKKIEVDTDGINFLVYDLDNNTIKIDIEISGNITNKKINGNLKIHTNSHIQPLIAIPIKGEST